MNYSFLSNIKNVGISDGAVELVRIRQKVTILFYNNFSHKMTLRFVDCKTLITKDYL
jgi:hypothetical protein